jgi:hypothetical protein
MSKWRNRIKDNLTFIVDNVKKQYSKEFSVIRVSFIGYSDHEHEENKKFYIQNFTDDIEKFKKFLTSFELMKDKEDWPEDVTGGLKKCLDQNWSKKAKKLVVHICEAPCHGTQYQVYG